MLHKQNIENLSNYKKRNNLKLNAKKSKSFDLQETLNVVNLPPIHNNSKIEGKNITLIQNNEGTHSYGTKAYDPYREIKNHLKLINLDCKLDAKSQLYEYLNKGFLPSRIKNIINKNNLMTCKNYSHANIKKDKHKEMEFENFYNENWFPHSNKNKKDERVRTDVMNEKQIINGVFVGNKVFFKDNLDHTGKIKKHKCSMEYVRKQKNQDFRKNEESKKKDTSRDILFNTLNSWKGFNQSYIDESESIIYDDIYSSSLQNSRRRIDKKKNVFRENGNYMNKEMTQDKKKESEKIYGSLQKNPRTSTSQSNCRLTLNSQTNTLPPIDIVSFHKNS